MARGLPCVTSDLGDIPELLPERWLVPAGDPQALASTMGTLCIDESSYEAASRANLARGTELTSADLPNIRRAFVAALLDGVQA
jgi:glycosyltransferase involved in cell wall biosynthesis